jgi:hypothetical protein
VDDFSRFMAQLRQPPGPASARSVQLVSKAFQGRHDKVRVRSNGGTYVPKWRDTPYGRVSRGLFWEADQAWSEHTRARHGWNAAHYTLGILAVLFAAVAGFGGLAQAIGPKLAAVIAIASGAASSLITFLKAAERGREHAELAAAWDSLRDDVTILYENRPAGFDQHVDPGDSQTILAILQARAKQLRAGKTGFEDRQLAWPEPGEAPSNRSD